MQLIARAGTNTFQEACWAWRQVPVPVVAAVHGHCYGGGADRARRRLPDNYPGRAVGGPGGARWGIIPDMSGIRSLAQHVGMDQAKRLTMTGEVVSGARAVEIGLATQVAADPVVAARELLAQIATRSPMRWPPRNGSNTWHAGPRRTFARERPRTGVLAGGANAKAAREAAFTRSEPVYGPRAHG